MNGLRHAATIDRLGAVVARALVLGGAWHVVSGGDAAAWVVGAPVVLAVAALPRPVGAPAFRWWRVDHLLRFAWFWAVHAVVGGVDVALRALHPRRSVSPDFVAYRLGLPPGPARALLTVTISMLPGTVAAAVVGRRLIVQRIHSGVDVTEGCRRAEALVALLFGMEAGGGVEEANGGSRG